MSKELNQLKKETKDKNFKLAKEGLDMVDFVMKRIYKIGNPVLILAVIGLVLFGIGFETIGMMFLFVVLAIYVVPLFLVLLILIFLAIMLVKLYRLLKEL